MLEEAEAQEELALLAATLEEIESIGNFNQKEKRGKKNEKVQYRNNERH